MSVLMIVRMLVTGTAHVIFTTFSVHAWFSLLLAALRYVTSGFVDDIRQWPGRGDARSIEEKKYSQSDSPGGAPDWGRSLMFTIA